MRVLVFGIAGLAALIAWSTQANAAPGDARGRYGCTFYEHKAGKGNLMRQTVDTLSKESRTERIYVRDVRYVGDSWNDRISSYVCDRTETVSCDVIMYDHIDFGGPGGAFHSDGKTPTFVGSHWNDNVSSMRIICKVGKISAGVADGMVRVDPHIALGMRRIESVNGKIRNLELTTGGTIVIRGRGFGASGPDVLQGWVTGRNGGGTYLHISNVTDTKIVARLTQTSAARTLWNRNERQAIRVVLRGDDWGGEVALSLPDSVYSCKPTDKLCK